MKFEIIRISQTEHVLCDLFRGVLIEDLFKTIFCPEGCFDLPGHVQDPLKGPLICMTRTFLRLVGFALQGYFALQGHCALQGYFALQSEREKHKTLKDSYGRTSPPQQRQPRDS